ncbi:MAG TPA: ACT domain-containing protein [Bacillota bacterium]|jgi:hypothetical protein|nr:ACT domain-containing protein [Bacillota bacterium]HOB86599.1 ACT domain-containing protein [Bacillota bacterium]HOP69850.1 ACT domain-containing protein [Bacillota bacterium]HPT34760.1 ACT domain-containing protein [Bacillota bacterium]HPZ64913.1 ACT domain-containing protein [Bacillota bacterium]
MVKQISVFLENKCGRLVRVTQVLGEAGINIRALSIADTSDFGILRLIVDKPDLACQVLREKGFMASETEVIAVEVPDKPGGLAQILTYLEEAQINIEYLYSFVEKPAQDALILMRVENAPEALRILREKQVKVIDGERIYSL